MAEENMRRDTLQYLGMDTHLPSEMAVSPQNMSGMEALTPNIEGFLVQDVVTHESKAIMCPYVKQLKTVKQIQTEEDYVKACNDLLILKKKNRTKGGTDLSDLVQAQWRKARADWSAELSDKKRKWKTEKSPYHKRMTKTFVKILCSVKYMSMFHVAHSKLKLDNILVHCEDETEIVQVIAFNYQVDEPSVNCARTPMFSSPEAIFFKRDRRLTYPTYNIEKDDVWQLGCIIFMMLAHQLPYDAGSLSDPNFRYATSGSFSEKDTENEKKEKPGLRKLLKFYKVLFMFTDDAIDLIEKIFVPEADRITLDEIFKHPWLKNELQELLDAGSLDWFRGTLESICGITSVSPPLDIALSEEFDDVES